MLTAWALASLAMWLLVAVVVHRTLAGVPLISAGATIERLPKVSIVVPARNEAAEIVAALSSKLECGYAPLEVIFVDDRSSDATGQLADEVASRDPRLTVVHVQTLPEGWLGKVHALERGSRAATGDWLLFSDADVVLAPGALQRLVSYAEETASDHLTVLPKVTGRGPLLSPALAAFFRVVTTGARLWEVPNPRSSAALGVGAFNLVRRSALERSPGLQWLRMEIADDVGLALMLKQTGARSTVVCAPDLVQLEFYSSFVAMGRAMEKNGASVPFPLLVLGNLALLTLELGFWFGPLPVVALGALVSSLSAFRLSRWMHFARWPTIVPSFGTMLLVGAMLRSGALALVRGGVRWRETLYPTAHVRAGRRVGAARPSVSEPGVEARRSR